MPDDRLPADCRMALKEWAVTVRALDRGEQILLLRKGGIREEGKDFRVIYPEFLLYPTFEHQKEELLDQEYHQDLRDILSQPHDPSTITFSHWARVQEVIELTEQERVDSLSPYHIWTNEYAQSRLHWKPRYPLSIMLLRLYRLAEPLAIAYESRYSGCKSWVDLEDPLSLGQLTPVLGDEEFEAKVRQVRDTLGLGVREPVRATGAGS